MLIKIILSLLFLLVAAQSDLLAFDCSKLESLWSTKQQLHIDYSIVSGSNYDTAKAQDIINRTKLNDNGYRDYIRYLFFNKDVTQPCLVNDPIIYFTNEYNKALTGNQTFENLSETMLKKDHNTDVVWEVDAIIAGGTDLYNTWLSKYRVDPSTKFIDDLLTSINSETSYSLRYFLLLLKDADGAYAEYMIEKTWELFMNKPQIVLSHLSLFKPLSDRIKAIFCEWKSVEERQILIQVYQKYALDKKAAVVLQWLSCNADSK